MGNCITELQILHRIEKKANQPQILLKIGLESEAAPAFVGRTYSPALAAASLRFHGGRTVRRSLLRLSMPSFLPSLHDKWLFLYEAFRP